MLTTIQLSEGESLKWSKSADLRSALRTYASKHARRVGRRFWQIKAVGGQLLDVGEVT